MAIKKDFQIVDVASNGVETILHPETNADKVLTGSTYRVPSIANINDWTAKSSELVNARKGKSTLKDKIDEIDNKLTAASLLASIKTVDGQGSGLDADTIDGKEVNDATTSTSNLWTSTKTQAEIDKRVLNTDVVATAQPNKILKLNSNGMLPANLAGNANTATTFANGLVLNFTGDVAGSTTILGNEGTKSIDLQVSNDSHSHAELIKNGKTYTVDDTGVSSETKIWSSQKVEEETLKSILTTLNEYIDATENEIVLGKIAIKYGRVDIANKTGVDVVFERPFGVYLFGGSFCETTDVNMVSTIEPGSATVNGINFNLNNIALDGSLIWFAVGM